MLKGKVVSGSSGLETRYFGGGLGYWYDGTLDLYYVRARWYEAGTGRWLSRDPVEGELPYTYVDNQPTTKVDPSGTQAASLGMLPSPGGLIAQANAQAAPSSPLQRATLPMPGKKQDFTKAMPHHSNGETPTPLPNIYTIMLSGEKVWHSLVETADKNVEAIFNSYGLTSSRRKTISDVRSILPGGLNLIVLPGEPNAIAWEGGFLYGIFETLVDSVISLPGDILKLILALFDIPKAIRGLAESIKALFGGLISLVKNWKDFSAYEKGKITGMMVCATIMLLAAGKGAVVAAKNVPKLFKSLVATGKEAGITARITISLKSAQMSSTNVDALWQVVEARARRVFSSSREPHTLFVPNIKVSVATLKQILRRVHMLPNDVDIVLVSDAETRSAQDALHFGIRRDAWVSRLGNGKVLKNSKGQSVIYMTPFALQDIDEAIHIVGEELAHISDFSRGILRGEGRVSDYEVSAARAADAYQKRYHEAKKILERKY